MTPLYDDIERRSIYQNVQLFGSNTDILNIAIAAVWYNRNRTTLSTI